MQNYCYDLHHTFLDEDFEIRCSRKGAEKELPYKVVDLGDVFENLA
jgi:hypothetical protein